MPPIEEAEQETESLVSSTFCVDTANEEATATSTLALESSNTTYGIEVLRDDEPTTISKLCQAQDKEKRHKIFSEKIKDNNDAIVLELRKELHRCMNELSIVTESRDELSLTVDTLGHELQSSNERESALQSALSQKNDLYAIKDNEIAKLQNYVSKVECNNQGLHTQLNESRLHLNESKSSLQQDAEDVSFLQSEHADIVGRLAETTDLLKESTTKNIKYEEKMNILAKDNADKAKELLHRKKVITQKESLIRDIKEDIKQVELSNIRLKQNIDDKAEDIVVKENEIEGLLIEMHGRNENIVYLMNHIHKLDDSFLIPDSCTSKDSKGNQHELISKIYEYIKSQHHHIAQLKQPSTALDTKTPKVEMNSMISAQKGVIKAKEKQPTQAKSSIRDAFSLLKPGTSCSSGGGYNNKNVTFSDEQLNRQLKKELEQSNRTITFLETELSKANDTLLSLKLKEKRQQQSIPAPTTTTTATSTSNNNKSAQELQTELKTMEENEYALRLRINQDYEYMKDMDESMSKMHEELYFVRKQLVDNHTSEGQGTSPSSSSNDGGNTNAVTTNPKPKKNKRKKDSIQQQEIRDLRQLVETIELQKINLLNELVSSREKMQYSDVATHQRSGSSPKNDNTLVRSYTPLLDEDDDESGATSNRSNCSEKITLHKEIKQYQHEQYTMRTRILDDYNYIQLLDTKLISMNQELLLTSEEMSVVKELSNTTTVEELETLFLECNIKSTLVNAYIQELEHETCMMVDDFHKEKDMVLRNNISLAKELATERHAVNDRECKLDRFMQQIKQLQHQLRTNTNQQKPQDTEEIEMNQIIIKSFEDKLYQCLSTISTQEKDIVTLRSTSQLNQERLTNKLNEQVTDVLHDKNCALQRVESLAERYTDDAERKNKELEQNTKDLNDLRLVVNELETENINKDVSLQELVVKLNNSISELASREKELCNLQFQNLVYQKQEDHVEGIKDGYEEQEALIDDLKFELGTNHGRISMLEEELLRSNMNLKKMEKDHSNDIKAEQQKGQNGSSEVGVYIRSENNIGAEATSISQERLDSLEISLLGNNTKIKNLESKLNQKKDEVKSLESDLCFLSTKLEEKEDLVGNLAKELKKSKCIKSTETRVHNTCSKSMSENKLANDYITAKIQTLDSKLISCERQIKKFKKSSQTKQAYHILVANMLEKAQQSEKDFELVQVQLEATEQKLTNAQYIARTALLKASELANNMILIEPSVIGSISANPNTTTRVDNQDDDKGSSNRVRTSNDTIDEIAQLKVKKSKLESTLKKTKIRRKPSRRKQRSNDNSSSFFQMISTITPNQSMENINDVLKRSVSIVSPIRNKRGIADRYCIPSINSNMSSKETL